MIDYDESVFWSNPVLANMILRLVEYQERTDQNFRENIARLEGLRDHIADIRKDQFGGIVEVEGRQAASCIPYVRQS